MGVLEEQNGAPTVQGVLRLYATKHQTVPLDHFGMVLIFYHLQLTSAMRCEG